MATAIPILPANYQSSTILFPGSAIAATTDMTFLNNGISAFFVSNQTMAVELVVTVTSVPDAAGRGNNSCDNLVVTVEEGTIVQFGPFTPVWWNQPNGSIIVSFSATDPLITVVGIQYA